MKITLLDSPVRRSVFKTKRLLLCLLTLGAGPAFSQTAYYVDGWHGGIWGHYPPWVTQFLVDKLKENPDWKINLEIEPESWDWIKANTPEAYQQFQGLFSDQSTKGRVEYINPGFAHSYLQLLLLRGAGGIGSAMFSVSAMGLLLRVVAPDQRGRSVGLFQGGFLLGGISGPAIGGPLAAWSIRAPFFVYAGTLVVAGSVAMIGLRRASLARKTEADAGQGGVDQPARTSLAAAFKQRAYRAALAANLADSWAAMGVRNTLVPLFIVESLHRGTAWVGIGFTIVALFNAATLIPAGRLVDRRGRRPVMVGGCLLSASSMALLALSPDLVGYVIAMVVFGIGSGLLDVAPAAVVGDVAGKRGGTVVAGFQMAGDGGSVSGPIVAGWVADTWSYGAAFWLTTGILAGAGALAARSPDIRER